MTKRKGKQRKQRKPKEDWKRILKFELSGLIILAIALIAISKLGFVGTAFVHLFRFFSGEWYMLFLVGIVLFSLYLIWKRQIPPLFSRQMAGIFCITASLLLLSHVTLFKMLSHNGTFVSPSVLSNTLELFWMDVRGEASSVDLGGGMLGAILFAASYYLFAEAGSRIIAVVLIVIGIILITGRSLQGTLTKILQPIGKFIKNQTLGFIEDMKGLPETWEKKRIEQKQKRAEQKEKKENEMEHDIEEDELQPIISSFSDSSEPEKPAQEMIIHTMDTNNDYKAHSNASDTQKVVAEETQDLNQEVLQPMAFVEVENKDYELPSIEILKAPKHNSQAADKKNIYENARKLEKTFQSFGVKAKVTQVHLGPAVTKYEVYPDVGVKVSKIVNLSDDLALALAAKDIRIEAPIPGKSAVGIEVPNSEVAMVSLREVLESKSNDRPDAKLLIGLGRDISGDAVLAELNKMPHLLVAGATGSGKSVCINGIITSILMRAKPHEVKLMMIDPKMVELNVYNGIPHLLAPVVTDPKKASQALKKVINEMERRYELFSHTGTRNIEGYNEIIRRNNQEELAKQPELPYIVVIVDELADLMMVASSDVEDSITRLSQMARAAGIHLIIATQRPSVDVITGVIKANIPSRIAFSVSSQTDSRTILDMGGAEKLLGRGDMLFLPVGASKPVRVQGAFLSDEEVEQAVDFVIAQQKAQYQEEMIPTEVVETKTEVTDDLYDDAVQLVVDMQTASVSMLQRRFRVGYTRAARLIDAMEERGVVGPYEGSKPRDVLISKEKHEELTS
ncbi:S-DNA-T family DNA segregation ATPase FtsK/SpoIIIE [Metabacillus crassostreae]|uniref:DNA translocase FtsK n=1 Tax=Metabacillus crassostreae TaxID=929098 RepID=UPI001958131F|nr:DNA translocase FtsK [Metabacillus crassostreae]MBM7603263.1 S-DNA-T family DNA segregation ATPase FtsK/SpoIIIE [Metabacillus crassostreae]